MKNAYDDDIDIFKCRVELRSTRINLIVIGRRERVWIITKKSKMAMIRYYIRLEDKFYVF